MTNQRARRAPREWGPFTTTTVQFPPEVDHAAREAAARDGVSLSWWLVSLAARATGLPQYDYPPAND